MTTTTRTKKANKSTITLHVDEHTTAKQFVFMATVKHFPGLSRRVSEHNHKVGCNIVNDCIDYYKAQPMYAEGWKVIYLPLTGCMYGYNADYYAYIRNTRDGVRVTYAVRDNSK